MNQKAVSQKTINQTPRLPPPINHYLNAVRNFVDMMTATGRADSLLYYPIYDDAATDPTLASQQVYGNRDDYRVIMVCAGTNHIWEKLPQKSIYLPTPAQLVVIKQQYGIVKAGLL